MNKSIKSSTLAAASLALLVATSHAATVFTDTFDSGTGGWFRAGTDGTLANDSGQLSWSPANDAIREVIGKSFTTQTLAVGETIRLTFDYTQTTAATGNIFRVGFYDVANPITGDGWGATTSGTLVGAFEGYNGFIRDDSGSANTIRTESGTANSNVTTGPSIGGTQLATISGHTTQFDIVQDTQYKVLFELTRSSSDQMDAVFKLTSFDGLTTHQNITGSTSTVQDDFNTVVLRSVVPVLFDNIQVEVISDLTTPSAFQLVITPNGEDYDFEWDSQTGKLYDLLSSTDLATPVASWPVYVPDGPGDADPLGDIPSAGATTTLTGVSSSDPRRFFAIREKD